MHNELAIIVLTYNSEKIILQCLQSFSDINCRIILVDNASTDCTIALVKENFKQVEIIQNKQNIGFSRGNNVALRNLKTKYALLLNPDVEISKKSISELYQLSKKNPNIAISGPRIFSQSKDSITQEVLHKQFSESNYYNIISTKNTHHEVDWIIGCAYFLDVAKFKELGLFDENAFMYVDDEVMSYAARTHGYQCAIAKTATAKHIYGMSTPSNIGYSYLKAWHLAWSKMYKRKQKKGFIKVIAIYPKICIKTISKFCAFLLKSKGQSAYAQLGELAGSTSFICGQSAFDKTNNPRGRWQLNKIKK